MIKNHRYGVNCCGRAAEVGFWMFRIEVFSEGREQLGESPLWDVGEERFYWIDSLRSTIYRADATGGEKRSWTAPEPIGALALREKGGAVLALQSGFSFFDFASGESQLIVATHPGEARARMNDGKVDRQGRFIAGSMDFEERDPLGKLFRLDPDLSLHVLDTNIVCSNGPCWSPDGRIFYFNDSYQRAIWAYDYDLSSGDVGSRRTFASFDKIGGYPDGTTVDEEGCVWSVACYGGRLVRFDPDGAVDRIVGLPVAAATSINFGGSDLDIAFVTSMALPFEGAPWKEREAGMTFAIHGLGVRGIPEPRFRG